MSDMKLLFGIKVSKTFRVNLLYKVGYHTGFGE